MNIPDHYLSLEHKTAVITGAGSGIGLAVARLYARYGASVAMLDVSDTCEDHAPEALRYAVMSRHPKPLEPVRKGPPAYDPFAAPRAMGEGFRSL